MVLYIFVDIVFGIDVQKGIFNGFSVSDDLYIVLFNVDDIDVNYFNEIKDNFIGFYLCLLYIIFYCYIICKRNNKK